MFYKGLKRIKPLILKSPQVTLVHLMFTSGHVTKPYKVTERDFRAAGDEAILLQVIPAINSISGEENEKSAKQKTEKENGKIVFGTLHINTLHDWISVQIEEGYPVQVISKQEWIIFSSGKMLTKIHQTWPLPMHTREIIHSGHLTGSRSGRDFRPQGNSRKTSQRQA